MYLYLSRRSFERDDLEVLSGSTPVLENPEHQTKWYYKYFLGKFHRNHVGAFETSENYFVLSELEETSFGKTQIRAVLWTRDGPKRLCLRMAPKSAPSSKQILAHFGVADKIERSPKEVGTNTVYCTFAATFAPSNRTLGSISTFTRVPAVRLGCVQGAAIKRTLSPISQ